jgi:hypothetical protein
MPKKNPGQSPISWPVVRLVSIRDRAPAESFREIDWSQLPQLRTIHLKVNHPEFTDNDLNSIPEEALLTNLDIASSGITNASIDKIKRFPELDVISVAGSKIDGAGLLQLVQETNLEIRAQLAASDLQSLAKAEALHRFQHCVLIADETFRAEQLNGFDPDGAIEFRGNFHPEAIAKLADYYKNNHKVLQFHHAELQFENLVDIGKMHEIKTAYFRGCKFKGTPDTQATAAAVDESTAAPQRGEPLLLMFRETTFESDYLLAFSNTVISITIYGKFVDDEWFHAVMNMPHVDSVELTNTAVSDSAREKYESVSMRAGRILYRRPAIADAKPKTDCP